MDSGGVLRMCGFNRNGMPETGEYVTRGDGAGVCRLERADGSVETLTVRLPDGRTPDGISGLHVWPVPFDVRPADTDDDEGFTGDLAERVNRTRLILEETRLGILSRREAGELLRQHLIHRDA